jgi:dihydroorotase/N-acyl-D-amino-acid deacylase
MKLLMLPVLLLLSLCAFAQNPQYDVLIRNGRVVDGSGNPWVYADVGIIGDRIAFVGSVDPQATAKRTIDAKGLIVAPGFIDMLGQSEINLLIDRQAVSKLTQGITTEITGEGESVSPQNDETIAAAKDYLDHYKLTIDWSGLDEYFRRLEKQGAGINLGTYVGAAQLREIAVGRDNRAPTAAELKQMTEMMEDAMDDGAMGVSSALIYAPGSYAQTDELIALATVAAQHGGIYASHIRNESDTEMQALEEAFRIGREAHIPVEIFHLKCSGRQNWGKMPQVIAAIERARGEGIDVTADQYPYIASATSLGATIPASYHAGGTDAFMTRLQDPTTRAAIRKQLEAPTGGAVENMWHGAHGPEGILVVSVLNPDLKKYEGKTIAQIAAAENKDPMDALFDTVIADRDNTGAVYFTMSEDDVRLAMQQPWVSVDNDYGAISPTGPLGDSKSHPRAYGSFPRILGKYVRDEHVLGLENAIRKFTSLPAQRVKLVNRGLLRPDYFADITIFNPETVHDVATFDDPNRPSVGIEYVLVNGVLSLEHGQVTGQTGGRPLRGPGWLGRVKSPDGLPIPGKIQGVITDEQGWPVGRVNITLKDAAGKTVGSYRTRYDGRYGITYESPCQHCSLHVERMGYSSGDRALDYNGANSLWFSFSLKHQAPPHKRTK